MGTPTGLLPWGIVGTIAGTAASVTLLAAALDPPLATAAAAGVAVGLGGTVMGGLGPAVAAGALALATVALGHAGPTRALPRSPSPLLRAGRRTGAAAAPRFTASLPR